MNTRNKSWLQKLKGLAADAAGTAKAVFERREPENTDESFRAGLPFVAKRAMLLTLGVMIAVTAAVLARYQRPVPPTQPVPFSHHFHVGTKNLSCIFCHNSVTRSSNAGMPPVEKCLLCHKVIATNFWPIRKLRSYDKRGEPVPWKVVNSVPGFVRFKHSPHLNKGIDCGYCHGNVASMDIVQPAHRFDMNFCITCHWRHKAGDTCFLCHY